VDGGALVTKNLIAGVVRFVGAGFWTVTLNEPRDATSAALMAAVSFVELTNVVVLLLPFHFTTAPLTKPVPFTVNVKAPLPATVVKGVRFPIEGMIDRFTALETARSGVTTVMGKTPTVVRSKAWIEALNCVVLIKVVERLRPLKRTVEPATKPEPLTVTVAPASPALTLVGEILLTLEASKNGEVLKKLPMKLLPDSVIKASNESDSSSGETEATTSVAISRTTLSRETAILIRLCTM
jgi:hypothetical protein